MPHPLEARRLQELEAVGPREKALNQTEHNKESIQKLLAEAKASVEDVTSISFELIERLEPIRILTPPPVNQLDGVEQSATSQIEITIGEIIREANNQHALMVRVLESLRI